MCVCVESLDDSGAAGPGWRGCWLEDVAMNTLARKENRREKVAAGCRSVAQYHNWQTRFNAPKYALKAVKVLKSVITKFF